MRATLALVNDDEDFLQLLTDLLESEGYRATRLIEEIQARMPTSSEARRLNLRPGVPVFSVQRVNHTADGRAVEVSVSVMSADRYRLVYELGEDG